MGKKIVLTPSQAAEYESLMIQARLKTEQATRIWEMAMDAVDRAMALVHSKTGE